MTNEEFAALVARLEPIAKRDPAGYQRRVVLLALLGYAYLASVMALLLALFLGSLAAIMVLKIIAIKLALVIGPFLWLIFRSLWVKFPPPDGIEVTRRDAPELFAMIDRLQEKLRCAHFHHVLISADFNAGVVQIPRLGPFGWHRNYLLIGLPFMKALTPQQLEAVLAHEFGHLAGGHGAMSNRLYRLRMSWQNLLAALQQKGGSGMWLFTPFFNRFAPYFSAYSFPLARANEYHADAVSARLCGARVAAQALTGVEVAGAYLGRKFWPDVHKKAETLPQPGFAPYQTMGEHFIAGSLAEDVPAWITKALEETTNIDNTHPAFADRLEALGQSAEYAPPAPGAAADNLLGAALARITTQHDENWQRAIGPSWQQRHETVIKSREALAAFAARENAGECLSNEDALHHALLIEEFGAGKADAFARLQALHQQAPDFAPGCYQLGVRLLERDDDAGIAELERCMALDPESILPCCRLLYAYCQSKQRTEEMARYEKQYAERAAGLNAISAERATVRIGDTFASHDLADAAREKLRAELSAVDGVRKAYFVRRMVKLNSQVPCYALGFLVTPWWRWQRTAEIARVQQEILDKVALPADTMVFCIEGANAAFARKFRKVPGSRVA